ncbi:sensor histidine kinase [Kocuria sp. SL71]|uniref:sensor histidine kinase n=1 Tax=Kocuria sp. SL71 TaxID=2995151 RepID=UPI0022747160|nr:sensor histidine kinase [Kocuria sp. SL71]MCY1683293.1 sensor histidine kinase [Kocuria sp. SL71]
MSQLSQDPRQDVAPSAPARTAPRPESRPTTAERLIGVLSDPSDPDWRRPGPGATGLRRDVLGALALFAVAALILALLESFAGTSENRPRWLGYLMVALQILPLAGRRRWPAAVMVVSTAVYVIGYYLTPMAAGQSGTVLGLYVAVYTLVAWGPSRQVVRIIVALFLVLLLLWVGIDLAITSSYAEMVEELDSQAGPFEPMSAYSAYSFLLNILGFGITIFLGWTSWRSALRDHQNRAQAEQLRSQSQRLARQAVVEERLRIARELHDVIAHHVSAIGIQAGAARKVLHRDSELTAEALRSIEGSSRQAVSETRQLLGVLRADSDAEAADGQPRAETAPATSPGPRLEEIEQLAREHAQRGLSVTVTWVDGAEAAELPPALGLSMYRCVQEAMSNVVRHSTATSAEVVIRSIRRDDHGSGAAQAIELEVLDGGRPRAGSAGTGFGLRGLRERVQLHGGTVEIGSRDPGPGWRVRARFPLERIGPEAPDSE